jgi:hypothetical protein
MPSPSYAPVTMHGQRVTCSCVCVLKRACSFVCCCIVGANVQLLRVLLAAACCLGPAWASTAHVPDVTAVASPLSDVLLDALELYLPLDTAVLDEAGLLRARSPGAVWDDLASVDTASGVRSQPTVDGDVELTAPGVSGGSACFNSASFITAQGVDGSPDALPRASFGAWVKVESLGPASTPAQPHYDHRWEPACVGVPVATPWFTNAPYCVCVCVLVGASAPTTRPLVQPPLLSMLPSWWPPETFFLFASSLCSPLP